jgi:CRISPR-associated endonuclease Csn1
MRIEEELTLGIDLGIASCGWALIKGGDGDGAIIAMGVWMFDAPETDKERTPTNQLRRGFRSMRRVLKRRRQRMDEIRRLLRQHGLIEDDGKRALWIKDGEGTLLNPWTLRAKGLDHRLTGPEFAVALGHIAKHRGFKSNSKRDRGANAPKETSEMLTAIEENRKL